MPLPGPSGDRLTQPTSQPVSTTRVTVLTPQEDADTTEVDQVVDVAGECRDDRRRHLGVRGGEPGSQARLPLHQPAPVGVQP